MRPKHVVTVFIYIADSCKCNRMLRYSMYTILTYADIEWKISCCGSRNSVAEERNYTFLNSFILNDMFIQLTDFFAQM
jgi:hypothetical protein